MLAHCDWFLCGIHHFSITLWVVFLWYVSLFWYFLISEQEIGLTGKSKQIGSQKSNVGSSTKMRIEIKYEEAIRVSTHIKSIFSFNSSCLFYIMVIKEVDITSFKSL